MIFLPRRCWSPRIPTLSLSRRRASRFRAVPVLGVLGLAVALASCGSMQNMLSSNKPAPQPSVPPPQAAPPTVASLNSDIGSGPVKVALIIPMTQASGPSVVGASLRNAAELALNEAGSNELTLLVRDDRSSPEGAREATQQALSDGAELFIGPLFAANVREAGRLARGAGKPMIAFSTDASAAQPGVYLLSFLVESYVERIVDYAASKGKKSIAALIPENDYGRVADAAFQQAAAQHGLRVMGIEHFQQQTLAAAAQKIASLGDQIDTLFIPEQADAMATMSQALTTAGINSKKVQILGTGLWNDARVLKLPALQGAWFAAPENGGFNAFAERYRAKFGSDPTRIATLSYDAVSLAAALAHTQGAQRYSDSVLINRSGFNGADGLFRFRPDGQNDRGLAVLQINNGTAIPMSPAPKSFSGTPSAT
ncbi:penicillin-binding protein activator [Beijerinckia indica]|uniref:Extracellular ligand-binding receptor n=1 Tax=Beijerinckia indica subsp. indica (strain ATCC 9039 / DSM 1715 / NCIMB 8712) TaxID=395963 RepID=B2IDR2_BEII9|nr:penicillin-binding protein activator [Beijerinckia indica]ACB96844.1 Extracellular ligand-binding receptor [Beijerinckia indica subsp. indica ATCC 9039]